MHQNKKAIFFDLDGTLMNTEPLHEKATELLLKKLCYSPTIPLIDLKGKTDEHAFYHLHEKRPLNITHLQFIDEKNQILLELIEALDDSSIEKLLTDGLLEFLRLMWQQGKMMCVVSASETVIVEALLQKTGVISFFDHIFSNGMTHLSKPHSSPYFHAMRHFKLMAHEVLIFEDSRTGLKAASSTGAHTIQILQHQEDNSVVHTNQLNNFNLLLR